MHHQIHKIFSYLLIIYLTSLHSLFSLSHEKSDQYIHALASLVFYTQEWEECLKTNETTPKGVIFSNEELSLLWTKIYDALDTSEKDIDRTTCESYLELAYQYHSQMKELIHQGQLKEAREAITFSCYLLRTLWEEAIESELKIEPLSLIRKKQEARAHDPNFDDNPYIPREAKKKMRPYLLPLDHPMRSVLDNLCLKNRVTLDKKNFHKAGFKILDERPRSFILVAKHSKMPGYLVKVYLDTVLREKQEKPSWKWLVYRCEGVQKVHKIINKRHIKHFVAPKKWIYCLPPEPSPPDDPLYMRHLALLLVTDMNLVSHKHNLKAWYSFITKEHLDELYSIISRAKGSSYRPDNISFTKDKKFAFIDTEYPFRGPDYKGIRDFLNPEMLHYWDGIVKHGGERS